jgi:hypothetical protein
MSVNISMKTRKCKKDKQANNTCVGTKNTQNCSGCDVKNPEYVLEDRQLCSDCYIAESHFFS